jgi:hypothetical protein
VGAGPLGETPRVRRQARAAFFITAYLFYESGRRPGRWLESTAPGPLASEDAVAGLRGTYGVCGIWRAAK